MQTLNTITADAAKNLRDSDRTLRLSIMAEKIHDNVRLVAIASLLFALSFATIAIVLAICHVPVHNLQLFGLNAILSLVLGGAYIILNNYLYRIPCIYFAEYEAKSAYMRYDMFCTAQLKSL